ERTARGPVRPVRLASAARDRSPAPFGVPGRRVVGRPGRRTHLLLRLSGRCVATAAPGPAAAPRPPGAASAPVGRLAARDLGGAARRAAAESEGRAFRRVPHLLAAAVRLSARGARGPGDPRADPGGCRGAAPGGRAVCRRGGPPARLGGGTGLVHLLS